MSRPNQSGSAAPASVEKIRDAALRLLAARGAAATSLREVADAAGVSIGLVQHHFGTKAGLIEAVDAYVVDVVRNTLNPPPGTAPDPDSVNGVGSRVTAMIADHTDVVDYMSRALMDNTPIGARIFDALFAIGDARWQRRAEQGQIAEGLDRTWAALNPILLSLGALILRPHLERHLPEPFTTRTQLARWEDAVNTLIRQGQLRPES
ncbi:MAG: helix-turn-helix transcriptional regulator [Mycobacterium sp.]|nr:helix-turn-helix transcriptional regulator [Mycobacterium sp.]